MPTLDCYGDTIESLADLSGRFDIANQDSYESWWVNEWRRVSLRLGFSKPFEEAMTAVTQSPGLGSIAAAPLNAFSRFAEERAKEVEIAGPWDAALLAKIRSESILAFKNKANIFDAVLPSWELPGGGCAGKFRVFRSAAAASYLRDQEGLTPRSPDCEWKGDVRIAFGLWPWYAGSLEPSADGLSWGRSGSHHPARDAMALCSSLWTPRINAREDARRVMALYDRFLERTKPVIDSLPESPTRPGAVYRDGRRLAVYLGNGAEETAVVLGPRGPIGVHAYNYCLERFAAFFACRRVLMEQFKDAPTNVQDALRANPDPCVGEWITPIPGDFDQPKPSPPVVGPIKGA